MPGTHVDIGRVGVWTSVLDAVPSARAAEAARLVEELGYGALWIPEVVGRDPLITASLLLTGTSRLVVATGIANIYARDAVTTANAQRTLDEAFPGRFLLGLGVSHGRLVEGVRHHDYSKPYSRMVRYLDEMDAASFRAVGPQELPTTVLAALGPRMLRLAGDRADGAHPYLVPVEHTARARELLGDGPILAPAQMVVLDADRARGLELARASVAAYLRAPNYVRSLERLGFTAEDLGGGVSDRLVDAIVAIGDAEAAVARVRAHFDAGATHVCLQVLEDDSRRVPEAGWRQLADALHASALF